MATYKVQKGDTLSAIANKYGTTYQEIAKANGISNPNLIQVGQTLNIGDASTGESSSANTETKAPSFTYEAYKPSDTVTQAEALLQQQLANKPGAYQSTWQDQLNQTLQQILNRDKFSYDMNADALYQQYKDQYTTQGKLAMMDTMGQAQAMTGGYGNSYAQSVGQQAYQGYLQGLNDKIPELYQFALNQYNAEGDAMYNNASLMAQMEDQDYGRYRDQLSDYYTELNRLTEDSRYQAEQDYSKWADNQNFGYTQYRDQVGDSQWQAEFDEAKRQYDEQLALQKKNSVDSSYVYTTDDGDDDLNTTNDKYPPANVRMAQTFVGATADGVWGKDSAAKAKALGFNSLDEVMAVVANGGVPPASYFSNWDAGDWEGYFADIRINDGRAAAEEELKKFTSKGVIPTNMVNAASIGARGGQMGH